MHLKYPGKESRAATPWEDAWHFIDRMVVKMGLGMLAGFIIGITVGRFVCLAPLWLEYPFFIMICTAAGLLCGYLWALLVERQEFRQSRIAVKLCLMAPPVFWGACLAFMTIDLVVGQRATVQMLKDVQMVAHASDLDVSISQTREEERSISFVPQEQIAAFQAALLRSEGYYPSHLHPLHEGRITVVINDRPPMEWYWCVPERSRTALVLENGDAYVFIDEGWPTFRQMLDK